MTAKSAAGRRSSEDIDNAVSGQTFPSLFIQRLHLDPSGTAIRWRSAGEWRTWTWRDYGDQAVKIAGALAALGIGRGDRVALMMRNCPEFHATDLAAHLVGATPFSIYNTSSVDQIRYLLTHACARVTVTESEFADKIQSSITGVPTMEHVFVVTRGAGSALGLPDFHTEVSNAEPLDLASAAEVSETSDLATLVYTSGTTGVPKGVMLTHHNICWMLESLVEVLGHPDRGLRMVSYLPMAHMLERMLTHYLAVRLGATISCCPDPSALSSHLLDVKPQLFVAPPRIWEKLRSTAMASDNVNKAAVLGLDECTVAMVGSAPTPPELITYFHTIDIPLSEAYGLSETTGLLAAETVSPKIGTVGRVAPGCDVQILDDGEICCRGGNVFLGYLDDPEHTAESVGPDGWFRTGDLGSVDADGYLRIIDRKKEIIITQGGKNIAPSGIEAKLKSLPLVGQACIIGEGRPYLTALLVLDGTEVATWSRRRGHHDMALSELALDPSLVSEIQLGIDIVNRSLSRPEQIKRFCLLDQEWLADSDILTPKMSLKRRGVAQRFAGEIAAMYESEHEQRQID